MKSKDTDASVEIVVNPPPPILVDELPAHFPRTNIWYSRTSSAAQRPTKGPPVALGQSKDAALIRPTNMRRAIVDIAILACESVAEL
jgi:hypothetical protein